LVAETGASVAPSRQRPASVSTNTFTGTPRHIAERAGEEAGFPVGRRRKDHGGGIEG